MNTLHELEAIVGGKRIRENEPLAQHTVLKKGGAARFYLEIDKTDALIAVIREAKKMQLPVFILGSGAFIDIPEKGIEGLVIKNNCHQFNKLSVRGKMQGEGAGVREVLMYAEAGVLMNQLVRYSLEEGLEGLEYQLGLPGTVGGAIVTNAKFQTHYLRKALHSMSILGSDGEVQVYTGELPYFVTTDTVWEETQDVVLSAVFKLYPGDKQVLWERGEHAVEYRSKI